MQSSEAEKAVREIVEREFLHQTAEKQYLNEAQIQFKLAIALYEKGVKDITPEWYAPKDGTDRFIDLMFQTEDGKRIAVELKYLTTSVEGFSYKKRNSQYSGRYYFLVDIARLESLKDESRGEYKIDMGFAVLIANDHLFWTTPKADTLGAGVDLGEKIIAGKEYAYDDRRSEPVILKRDYPVRWLPERGAGDLPQDGFRYVLVAV